MVVVVWAAKVVVVVVAAACSSHFGTEGILKICLSAEIHSVISYVVPETSMKITKWGIIKGD